MKFKTLIMATIVLFAASTAVKAGGLRLNFMTFNVRYDNPDDSLNNWKYRKAFAAKMIAWYDVDVLGTQEVLHNQLADLLSLLPQYTSAGVGRLDGKTAGEYSAVFYRKDKFELLKTGNFWLSETPEKAGVKGWDAACERIVTWVILQEKASGKKFAFINTHFDHMGQVARRESAKLLISKVKSITGGLPYVVTGDFNASPQSEVISILTDPRNPDHLTDSRSTVKTIYGPAGTFHGFGKVPYEKREIIDYLFIGNGMKGQRLGVIAEMQDATFLSDHHPVLLNAIF